MSDLSRLLDDVYGEPGTGSEPAPDPSGAAPTATLPGLPDWAVDSVLDDAFADWVPGPPAGDATARPVAGTSRSALSELAAAPAPAAPEQALAWSREDDDILPSRRGRRGRPVAPAAAAPVIESFAAEDEPAPAEKAGRFRRRKG